MGQPQTLLTGMNIEQLSCTFLDENRLKINSTLAFQYRNTEKICPLKPLVSSISAGGQELARKIRRKRDEMSHDQFTHSPIVYCFFHYPAINNCVGREFGMLPGY